MQSLTLAALFGFLVVFLVLAATVVLIVVLALRSTRRSRTLHDETAARYDRQHTAPPAPGGDVRSR